MTAKIVSIQDHHLVIPHNTSFEDWYAYREQLEGIHEWQKRLAVRSTLHVMDWLMHGEAHYGEEWSQGLAFVEDVLGWRSETYGKYRRVLTRFDDAQRRPNLTISHYLMVEGLDPNTANRVLEKASQQVWTVKQTKIAVSAVKPNDNTTHAAIASKSKIISTALRLLNSVTDMGNHYAVSVEATEALAEILDITLEPPVVEGEASEVDVQSTLGEE